MTESRKLTTTEAAMVSLGAVALMATAVFGVFALIAK